MTEVFASAPHGRRWVVRSGGEIVRRPPSEAEAWVCAQMLAEKAGGVAHRICRSTGRVIERRDYRRAE